LPAQTTAGGDRLLHAGTTPAHEMDDRHDNGNDDDYVDESPEMECQEPEQPKHQKYRRDREQHQDLLVDGWSSRNHKSMTVNRTALRANPSG
jgi:hypothetical protein